MATPYDPTKPASDTNMPEKSTMGQLGMQALKELHEAIGNHLGIGQGDGAGKHVVDGKPKSVMDAVDDAVKGAPAPGGDY